MTINEAFFLLLIVLNILDIHTTIKILDNGGKELNPVMAWLIDKLGIEPALVASKALFLAPVGYYLPSLPVWLMAALIAVYVYVVSNNFIVLKKLEH